MKSSLDGESSWLLMDGGEHQPGRRPAEAWGVPELLDVIYVFAFLHMIDEAICRAPEAPLELQVCSQVGASCPRLGRTWIFWVSWISDG